MSLSRKIEPTIVAQQGRSFLACLSKFLVKILAIPVKVDPDFTHARFKLFSLRTLVFLVIYYGVFLGYVLTLMFQQDFLKDIVKAMAELHNPFDSATGFIFQAMLLFAPVSLLCLAHTVKKK